MTRLAAGRIGLALAAVLLLDAPAGAGRAQSDDSDVAPPPLLIPNAAAVAAPRRPRGHDHGPPPKRASLFISPAGEPFHAAPGAPYPVAVWFGKADLDHDGKLTRDEFRADFQRFFNILDENHDGVIDGFEVGDYETKIAPEILPELAQQQRAAPPEASQNAGQAGGRGGGRRRGGMGAGQPAGGGMRSADGLGGVAPYSLINVAEPVSSTDTDFNGRVSLQEFLAAADRRFNELDTQNLGYLSLSSLPHTPEQLVVEGKKPQGGKAP